MTCAPPPGLPSYTSLPVFLSSKRAATQRFPSFGLPCSPAPAAGSAPFLDRHGQLLAALLIPEGQGFAQRCPLDLLALALARCVGGGGLGFRRLVGTGPFTPSPQAVSARTPTRASATTDGRMIPLGRTSRFDRRRIIGEAWAPCGRCTHRDTRRSPGRHQVRPVTRSGGLRAGQLLCVIRSATFSEVRHPDRPYGARAKDTVMPSRTRSAVVAALALMALTAGPVPATAAPPAAPSTTPLSTTPPSTTPPSATPTAPAPSSAPGPPMTAAAAPPPVTRSRPPAVWACA